MHALAPKIPLVALFGRTVRTIWRKELWKRRLAHLKNSKNLRIVIGSSGTSYAGWTKTDIEYLNLLEPTHWERAFTVNSLEAILAEHVWEHLSWENGKNAAQQCYDYLMTGGHLRVAVPDGWNPDPAYIEWVRIGGTGPGADDHKMLYNIKTISELFTEVGFTVEGLEYFDEGRNFIAEEWNPSDGFIRRSRFNDPRNSKNSVRYTSLIIDAKK